MLEKYLHMVHLSENHCNLPTWYRKIIEIYLTSLQLSENNCNLPTASLTITGERRLQSCIWYIQIIFPSYYHISLMPPCFFYHLLPIIYAALVSLIIMFIIFGASKSSLKLCLCTKHQHSIVKEAFYTKFQEI